MANSTTTPRDNIIKNSGFQPRQDTTALGGSTVSYDFFQGDLLWFDSSAGYAKPVDSDAHAAYLLGVAARSAYIAPFASMQVLNGPAIVKNYFDRALFYWAVIASFYTTSGDTYTPESTVYIGANAQTITNASGSHAIGIVKLPEQITSLAGGSNVLVNVLVLRQFPVQSL